MKELGIYIHIPFCVSKCNYCNFTSYTGVDNLKDDYVKAIIQEILAFSSDARNYIITSIYIGGGTPSCMGEGVIPSILKVIFDNYNVSKVCEISTETNPNSITIEKAKEWKKCGINRVSIGLQSSNNNLLKIINRPHKKSDYLNAIKILKKVGFKNINTDIMIGLPHQTLQDVKDTINLVLKTRIPHISAYSLILEEDTPLFKMVQSGDLSLPSEDLVLEMYDYVKNILSNHKIYRYEVSNFAKKKHECLHNLNCWNMVEYVGFGVGANGFINNIRYGNVLEIEKYIYNINNNISVKDFSENQTQEDLYDEYIMLKLRTSEGIDLDKIQKEFNINLLGIKKNEIDLFIKHSLIKIENNFLSATDKGFKVLNQIIIDLVC